MGAIDERRDTWQSRSVCKDLGRARASAGVDPSAIDELAELALELLARVEGLCARSDRLEPGPERKLGAMLAINLLPGLMLGCFGVENQTVEIEDEGANGCLRIEPTARFRRKGRRVFEPRSRAPPLRRWTLSLIRRSL